MNDRLAGFLKENRAALNRRVLALGALRWAAGSALVSAVAIVILRLMDFGFAPLPPWAILTLLGSIWGAFRARRRLLDLGETARWLDARHGNGELLSAALFCAGRGEQGPFDAAVMERAEAFINSAPTLRPSRSIFAKRFFPALGILLLMPLGLAFAPVPRFALGAERLARGAAAGAEARGKSDGDAAAELGRQSPESIARGLFPEERRLAALAERSIREGRLDDLREILNRSELDYRDRIKRAKSALERSRLKEELEQFQNRKNQALGEDQASQGKGANAEKPESAKAKKDPAGGEQNRPGMGAAQPQGEEGGRQDRNPQIAQQNSPWSGGGADQGRGQDQGGQRDSSGGQGIKRGGGNGEGSPDGTGQTADWGKLKGSSFGEKLLKDDPERERQFEFVMAGGAPALGKGFFTVRSGRVAEAAVSREAAPRDYEEYIRSYFISLSKLTDAAESPATGGLGGKGVQQ